MEAFTGDEHHILLKSDITLIMWMCIKRNRAIVLIYIIFLSLSDVCSEHFNFPPRLAYSANCGSTDLRDNIGTWHVNGKITLAPSDLSVYTEKLFIQAAASTGTISICEIDLAHCGPPSKAGQEYCYCSKKQGLQTHVTCT